MSEIIGLHLGQAGIRIGQSFLKKIINEHELEESQARGVGNLCFFHDKQQNRQCRNIFIDKQQQIVNEVRQDIELKKRVKQKNIINGNGNFSNVYGGYAFIEGRQLLDQFMEKVRIQTESCDKLSGFLMTDSLGGGFNSGFGNLALMRLRQQYCGNILQNYPILPDLKAQVTPIQIYNATFSFHHNVENADMVMLLQNNAAQKRVNRKNHLFEINKEQDKSLTKINDQIAQLICQNTSPYRFCGTLNNSQRKRATNIVMFPRMKFLCSSFSLKTSKQTSPLLSCLDFKNYFITNFFANPVANWDIYCMSAHCRDNFAYQQQINVQTKQWMMSNHIKFSEWIPNSLQVSISKQSNEKKQNSGNNSSILINSRHVINTLQRISQNFTNSFRRKAFVHHYTSLGIDQMQFTQAESNMNDLVSQYQPCVGFYDQDEEFIGIEE